MSFTEKIMVGVIEFTFKAFFIILIGTIPFIIIWKLVSPTHLMQLSDGTMRATSAKLSYKGVIWKTHEGWIPIGVNSEGGLKKWEFTVKDGDQSIIDCINNNEKVRLHYKDYVLMPYRYGSSHQVDSCEVIR